LKWKIGGHEEVQCCEPWRRRARCREARERQWPPLYGGGSRGARPTLRTPPRGRRRPCPQVGERGAHARGRRVDAPEARAEADEVGVVAVEGDDELGTQLGGEAVEEHVGAELGDVGVRVEVGAEEGAGPEPRRVRLDWLPEEVDRPGRHGEVRLGERACWI
jgi:hypothetical protein